MQDSDHILLVYFFYGLYFIFMGLFFIFQPVRKDGPKLGEHLWLLGFFGLLQGVGEWLELVRLLMANTWGLGPASYLDLPLAHLTAMSFLCLFQFAANLISSMRKPLAWLRWMPLAVFSLWLFLFMLVELFPGSAQQAVRTLLGWMRASLGLGGGLVTCYALIEQKNRLSVPAVRKILLATAVLFAISSFLSLGAVSQASFRLMYGFADLFPSLKVHAYLSASLMIFRAVCTLLITFTMVQALIRMDAEQHRALQQAHEELQQSYDHLKATQAQLIQAEKTSAVGVLVGGIAHEFNNVLTGLKGYTELARNSNDVQQIHRDLEVIEQAADRTVEITRNLLTWVRPERRPRDFCDINGVIQQAVALVRPGLSGRTLQVTVSLGEVPTLQISKGEVQDIVMNLLMNASRAIADGVEGHIEVSTALEGSQVCLRVSDNGTAIAPEDLSGLFLPSTKGSGLGLYVVHNIVKNRGGEVEVNSQQGQGTTFRLMLPVPEQPVSVVEPAVAGPKASILAGLRIIVIDDEDLLRRAMARFLEQQGAQVTQFHSGQAALDAAGHTPADVIFLDLMMPGLDGVQTLQRLRQWHKKTPVLMMTGKMDQEIRDELVSKGAFDVISKPFVFSQLGSMVLNAVSHV